MTEPFARLRRFLRGLQRRKVYRAAAGFLVAAGYLVAAFVVFQLASSRELGGGVSCHAGL